MKRLAILLIVLTFTLPSFAAGEHVGVYAVYHVSRPNSAPIGTTTREVTGYDANTRKYTVEETSVNFETLRHITENYTINESKFVTYSNEAKVIEDCNRKNRPLRYQEVLAGRFATCPVVDSQGSHYMGAVPFNLVLSSVGNPVVEFELVEYGKY